MDLGLSNKVIMVAASSKGLGYGIAKACAEEGAKVAIASRTKNEIVSARDKLLLETGSEVMSSVLDVKNPKSIQSWISEVVSNYGTVDGLVINAGGPPAGTFSDFTDSDWQNAFELNLLSAVRMAREVIPIMKEKGSGSILVVTSSSVREPTPNLVLSNVIRSGVASLIKSLANDLGQSGIRVNNIVPGRIDTERVGQLDANLAETKNTSVDQIRAGFEKEIPLGRYGLVDEFGKAGAFLLSDAASYINGATLLVDGGKAKSIW